MKELNVAGCNHVKAVAEIGFEVADVVLLDVALGRLTDIGKRRARWRDSEQCSM